MKRFAATLVVAFVLPSIASAQYWDYDIDTGDVSIYGLTTHIGIDVQSTDGDLIGANGLVAPGDIYDTSLAPNILSWLNFGGFDDPKNLGNIFGLPGSSSPAPGTVTILVIPGFGVPGEQIPYAPEPASLLLAGLGLACAAARRRR